MLRRSVAGRVAAAVAGLACAVSLPAQAPQQASGPALSSRGQSSTAPSLAQRSEIVRAVPEGKLVLDVVARNAKGELVPGLGAADFTVVDAGRPVRDFAFAASEGEKTPVEIVLVIDALTLDISALERTREQVGAFLSRDGGRLQHPVSVVSIEKNIDKPERAKAAMVRALGGHSAYLRLFPYTRDGNALRAQLERSKIYPAPLLEMQGGEGGSQRMQSSLEALSLVSDAQSHVPGRKIMIWLSPGWPVPAGDPHSQEKLFNEISFLASGLARARITLYNVDPLGRSQADTTPDNASQRPSMVAPGLAGPTGSGPLGQGVFSPAPEDATHATYSQLTLAALATQSGGEVLADSNDTVAEIARCAADADSFYSLTYTPARIARANTYRPVQVKVAARGVTARTVPGYYWQPEGGKAAK